MNIAELIARLVERRAALEPAEEEALLAALDADPALAQRLARQFSTDEALGALLRPERSDLAARVRSALDSAASARFVDGVHKRIDSHRRRGWLVVASGALSSAAQVLWKCARPRHKSHRH